MSLFGAFAILVTLTALFSFVNHIFMRLPKTIGLLICSLAISLALMGFDLLGYEFATTAAKTVATIDFSETLLKGVLCFILFAGSLHIDLVAFWERLGAISVLATVGVLISTAIVGAGVYYLLPHFGMALPFTTCLLFGALISPTDPIAVLALLKEAKVEKSIEMKVAGESVFNDGVGVVVFLVLLGVVTGSEVVSAGHVAHLAAVEVLGGLVLGLIAGYGAFHLIKRIDDHPIEILITIALVAGTYYLADVLHTSGPLAIVVAGLFIGNRGRQWGMSLQTRESLDLFWEVVDDVLNASLFVLVGFEVLLIAFKMHHAYLGLFVIPLVLGARFISVACSWLLVKFTDQFQKRAILILTWGGLRGGISLALALTLPQEAGRDTILVLTYIVVVFSIVVQGLTFKPLIRRLGA